MTAQPDQTINISGRQYRLSRLLAETANCRVWAATDLATDTPVAIKAFHTLCAEKMQSIIEEIALYKALPATISERFVPFYHHGCWRDGYAFVMAQMDSDLSGVSFDSDRSRLLSRLWLDIAQALDCLHHNGYLHLDLKPANILCNYDLDQFFLGDFGSLKALGSPANNISSGTPGWMAPEQRYSQLDASSQQVYKVSPATDIYTLGLLMYVLITQTLPDTDEGLPFEGGLRQPEIETLQRGLHQLALEPCLCTQLERIIVRCLKRDPTQRPGNLTELVELLKRLNGRTGKASYLASTVSSSTVIPLLLDSPPEPQTRISHRGAVVLAMVLVASVLSYELVI